MTEDIVDLRVVQEHQASAGRRPDLARLTSLILSSTADGIYGVDENGRTTFVNTAAERMLGWDAIELIGRPVHRTIHHTAPDGRPYPDTDCPTHQTLKDGIARSVTDDVFWRQDGTSFPVEFSSTPLWDQGVLSGAVITFRDITERKRSETLRTFHQFLEELPSGVFVLDAKGVPMYANKCATELLGSGIDPSATPDRLAKVYKTFVAGSDTEYPGSGCRSCARFPERPRWLTT